MNKLEHKLQNTLEAMSRTARSQNIPQSKKSYILSTLENHYRRLNERYVKHFHVDYNPARRGNICYGE